MKNRLSLIIIIFIIVGAVIGGLYIYNKDNTSKQDNTKKIIFDETAEDEDLTEEESIEEEPSPTPDFEAYEISVLNGSGTTGKAGEVKSFLEEKGFKVNSVGNADNYDYTKTVISYKKDVSPVYLDALKLTLEERFIVDNPVTITATEEGQVIVTVGSEAAE